MYLLVLRRDGEADSDTVIPPWATVAIALIIYAIIMLFIGVICHRYGCLGSKPSTSTTPITAQSPRQSSYSSSAPSRRVSQTIENPRTTTPRRKERPMSHLAGLTSSDTVNRAMLHPPPPAYVPLPSYQASMPPITPVIEKGHEANPGRASRHTSHGSSVQFSAMR